MCIFSHTDQRLLPLCFLAATATDDPLPPVAPPPAGSDAAPASPSPSSSTVFLPPYPVCRHRSAIALPVAWLPPAACCCRPPSHTTLTRHLPPSPRPSPPPHLSRPITPPISSSQVHSPSRHLPHRHGHIASHRRGRLDLTSSSDQSIPCPSPLFPTPPLPSTPITALAVLGSTFGSIAVVAPHRRPVLSDRTTPTFRIHLLPAILLLSLPFSNRVRPPNL